MVVRGSRVLLTFSVATVLMFVSRLKVMMSRSLMARGGSVVMLA